MTRTFAQLQRAVVDAQLHVERQQRRLEAATSNRSKLRQAVDVAHLRLDVARRRLRRDWRCALQHEFELAFDDAVRDALGES